LPQILGTRHDKEKNKLLQSKKKIVTLGERQIKKKKQQQKSSK
jgi:hypothetical protein